MSNRPTIEALASFTLAASLGWGCTLFCEDVCWDFDTRIYTGTYAVEGYSAKLFGDWAERFDRVIIESDGVVLVYLPTGAFSEDATRELRWPGGDFHEPPETEPEEEHRGEAPSPPEGETEPEDTGNWDTGEWRSTSEPSVSAFSRAVQGWLE